MPYPYRTAGTTRAIGTERAPTTPRAIGTERVLPTIDYLARWGVVEHWAGNETSGARLASISSANDMTAVNAPTSNPGLVYPLARQYTAASSQYHSLADNAAMSTGDIDFWVSGWVYFNTVPGVNNYPTITGKYAGGQKEYILYYNGDDSKVSFEVSANGTTFTKIGASTFGVPVVSTWYYVIAYHDAVSNLIGISVNGGSLDTAAYSSGSADRTSAFLIGSNAGATTYWNGRVGPVTFGKSPPGGIAALATEIRDRMYANGAGKVFPFR